MMKDPTEFSYPRGVAASVIERLRASSDSNYELWFLAMLEVIADAEKGPTVYAACTCGAEDKPSQWRDFADFGRGFAIGLNRRALYDAASAQGYSLFTLIYDAAEQREFLETQVREGTEALPGIEESMGKGPGMALLMGLAISFPLVFPNNPQYASEEEWRIGRLDTGLDDGPYPPKGVWDDGYEYESVALGNPVTGEKSITDVVAGPNATSESIDDARRLLQRKGLGHIEIRRSALSE